MSEIHHSQSVKLEQLRQKRKECIAQREWEGALQFMNQIVALDPNTDNYNQCGLLLLQLQRYQDALHNFEKALALTPDSRQALDGIARATAHSKGSTSGTSCRGGSTSTATTRHNAEQQGEKKTAGGEPTLKNLARYQIKKELGRGGMGTVYRAYDPDLKRDVALKTVLPGSDSSIFKRFAKEADAMSKLSHPHIVRIYDVGNAGDTPYLTMEFIEGKSLSEIIREEKLPLRRAVELVRKVAQAIHYAHSKGILHRDIKPANIMIDNKGEPRVMDFGLALDVSSETRLSQTGIAVGTPAYMSPEQALGKKKELDERSDVYSLGAVMYELVTGIAPFRGATSQIVFQQVIDKDPVAPRKIVPRLPKELEKICLKAMAKEKAQRYADAEELATDLDRFLNKKAVLASGPNIVYRVKKWVKQNRTTAAAGGSIILLLLCAGLFYIKIQAKEREIMLANRRAKEAEERIKKEAEERIQEAERKAREAQLEAERKAREAKLAAERKAREAKLAADTTNKTNKANKGNAQAVAHNNKGIEFWEGGKMDEALQEFKKALALDPNLVSSHSNIAAVYAEQGKFDDAMAELRIALRLDPDYAKAHHNLGVIYYQQRKFAQAIESFRKALILEPDSASNAKNLGNAYYESGNHTAALALYEKLIAAGYEDVALLKRTGMMYHRQKKPAEAARLFTRLAELRPNDDEILSNLALILYSLDKPEEAIKNLNKAIAVNPKSVDAHNNLGAIYFNQDKKDEALVYFNKALSLDANAADPHFNLAFYYYKQQNWDKALQYAQRYLELAPEGSDSKRARSIIDTIQKKNDNNGNK